VLLPWDAIDLGVRRKLVKTQPIAAENRHVSARVLFGIAAACGFILVLVSGSGFGHLSHAWLVQGAWFTVAYGLLLAGVLVPSVWLARRVFSRQSWLPYERALLPLDAIEATHKGLIVRPFGDARFAETKKQRVYEIAYADTSTFRIRLDPTVDERMLLGAELILERASLTTDEAYRAGVDPFHDLRGDEGLRAHPRAIPFEARSAGRSARENVVTVVLVIASFMLATFLLGLRNRLSDDAAFSYARHENVRAHYEAYLDSGGKRHARDVNDDLLPRLVLDEAKARNDPDAVAAFLTRFPGSRFDAEAHAALVSTCSLVGGDYTRDAKVDVFDMQRFVHDHPVCAEQRATVIARFFDAKREALRHYDLEPALRDTFIALVDRAERTGTLAVLEVRASGVAKSDRWPLEWGLRGVVGPVIDLRFGASASADEWLEIRLSDVTCTPGYRPLHGALQVWFHTSKNAEGIGWSRRVNRASGIFTALVTNEQPPLDELCAPVMP
jgi:hypothetical protein